MAQTADGSPRTRSRFWLFAPVTLLILIGVAWSAAWFMIRARTGDAINAWFAREAAAGRTWTCQDRALGGYPFRVEFTCSSLRLQRGTASASFGQVEAVAQVYQPRLVIAEIEGPLRWEDGQVAAEAAWRLLQTSVHMGPSGLIRASLVAEEPRLRVTGPAPTDVTLAAQSLEAHARPDPARPAGDGAYDVAVSARQARIPALETWVGNADPVDLQADTIITQAQSLGAGPLMEELERWRATGGEIDMRQLLLTQGSRRLQANGALRLDEAHRPAGRLEVSGSGLESLMALASGGRVAAGDALLGALLGSRRDAQLRSPDAPHLPALRLDGGRVFLGPFPLPGARLPALY